MQTTTEPRYSVLCEAVDQAVSNLITICNLTDNKYIDEIATQTVDELLAALKLEQPEQKEEKQCD